MKAWRLISSKKLELFSSEPTQLDEINNAKVKIEKALISAKDYNEFLAPTAKLPFILGRYGVGVVSKLLNEESEFHKGDRVVVNPTISCRECIQCRSGNPTLCENPKTLGIELDGLYRDFVDLPLSNLYKLPDTVSFDKALFIGHISHSLNILDKLEIAKGDHVAVFSETKLGLLIAQLVSYYGAIPILIDKDDETLDTARELGIFYTFNYTNVDNLADSMFNITSGRLCEKVVFLANTDYPFNDAISVCKHNGRICVAQANDKTGTIDLTQLVEKQITICCVNYAEGNFPTAINLLATNKVDTSCMTGSSIKFDDLGKQIAKVGTDSLKHRSVIINVD